MSQTFGGDMAGEIVQPGEGDVHGGLEFREPLADAYQRELERLREVGRQGAGALIAHLTGGEEVPGSDEPLSTLTLTAAGGEVRLIAQMGPQALIDYLQRGTNLRIQGLIDRIGPAAGQEGGGE